MEHTALMQSLPRYALRMVRMREAERARMAQDLHDVLGNTLAALKMEARQAAKSLEKRLAVAMDLDSARCLQRINAVDRLVDDAIASMRELVRNHHPRVLQERGLVGAIERLVDEFSRRHGVRCVMSIDEHQTEPDEDVSLAFYRIVQEALTNIARHSQAQSVVIRLRERHGQNVLEIEDNGVGFVPAAAKAERGRAGDTTGLGGMRARMNAVGGTCAISASPGAGVKIVASAPVGWSHLAAQS